MLNIKHNIQIVHFSPDIRCDYSVNMICANNSLYKHTTHHLKGNNMGDFTHHRLMCVKFSKSEE